jgi:ATP-dependent transcriptional regulator
MPIANRYKPKTIYLSDKLKASFNSMFEYPLTIVEAPMGYGKTTAVRESLKNTEAHVLWQRIYDNSVTGFWSNFCRRWSELDADRSQDLGQLGFPNDSVSLLEALRLIENIELPEKTVLVIDDYHLLSGTEVGSFISFLVVSEIEHLHIVLTTRFTELLSIEELSLKGYLCHITKETFELKSNEIKQYYMLCGVSLKDSEADKLYEITEGWISALYLLVLNFIEKGSFTTTDNIYKLIENTIYKPFDDEIKELLNCLCIFDSFTAKQAKHMWRKENVDELLNVITRKNAFVNYDADTKSYQIHTIFINFLKEIFEKEDTKYKKNLYKKAGYWYMKTGEYIAALNYFYIAGDFENLLEVVELDKANSFVSEQKELFIRCFEECPEENKQRHPIALLIFAMGLMTFNEMGLFEKVCGEFAGLMQSSNLDPDSVNRLMGEFELLLSFTKYNDIMGMSEHHKKACELLKEPAVFMDAKGSWTFGSPSVLYMFYREPGKLEKEVQEMKVAMPYYYQLTKGHGTGAEHVMEAEWHFIQGDFENAEITVHKALYLAGNANQTNMVVCALFLQVRLALMKGDYADILQLLEKMNREVEQQSIYVLMHTLDMCAGFVYGALNQSNKIHEWLSAGDFNSSRLFFPARAFSNILYGRILLVKGEYLKLLGIAGQFLGIASFFPNQLAKIYTFIYMAAANERIFRNDEALQTLKQALELAVPDKVYMPFVENGDFIKPLLEVLYAQGSHREDIAKILELYRSYEKAREKIIGEHFIKSSPRLTAREMEIAQLVAEGLSNKGIGEKLFTSPNTVKKQLKSIFEKLGVNSRVLINPSLLEKIN